MTNGIKDLVEALRVYRLKDLIEMSFGNLKERLSMRRMSVTSEENFEGKLFVQVHSTAVDVLYPKNRWMKMACSVITPCSHCLMSWMLLNTTNSPAKRIICLR